MDIAIYPRRSLDRSGRGKGVTIQVAECRDYLQEQPGWTLREVYQEDGAVSASRYATRGRQVKDRPRYRQLLADVEAGRVAGILMTEVSRLDRDVGNVLDLVYLADRRRFMVATTSGALFRLGTADGNYAFIEAVNKAQHESAQLSERVRRTKRTRRAEGAWNGGRRPTGYQVQGTTVLVDGKPVLRNGHLVVDPTEAEMIRDAVARILAGGSLTGVVRDWYRRGWRGPDGGIPSTSTVRAVLTAPRTAGRVLQPDGTLVAAQWDPILSLEEWERVCAILEARAVKLGPQQSRKHLLSGILFCADCVAAGRSGRMLGNVNGGHATYQCASNPRGVCHFRIRGQQVDTAVRGMVLTALASPEFRAALATAAQESSPDPTRAAGLVARRTELETALGELRAGLGTRISLEDFEIGRDNIQAERVRINAELARMTATGVTLLAELPTDFDALVREWKDRWDLDRRQTVLKAALRGVRISRPHAAGSSRFHPERDLDPDWRV